MSDLLMDVQRAEDAKAMAQSDLESADALVEHYESALEMASAGAKESIRKSLNSAREQFYQAQTAVRETACRLKDAYIAVQAKRLGY